MHPQQEQPQQSSPALSPVSPVGPTGSPRLDELPPSARAASSAPSAAGDAPPPTRGRRFLSGWRGAVAAAAVAIGVGLTLLNGPGQNETDAPNGPQVVAATESASRGGDPMQWVARNGIAALSSKIIVSQQDRDLETTQKIRQALEANDTDLADRLLAGAQSIPPLPRELAAQVSPTTAHSTSDPQPQAASPASAPQPVTPSLTTGMREEIRRGDADFFHIYLYDSCWNDGDIVEILINGRSMFIVPITNAGATLSVPVSTTGTTVIAVRGVFDGGGGITVACRTSQGDGFVRVMAPGEVQPLGAISK